MILDDLLNQVIDLLEHPEFKNFGALQKHRYQMEHRNDDDIELRRALCTGLVLTKEQKEKMKKNRLKQNKRSNRLDKLIQKVGAAKRSKSYHEFLARSRNSDDLSKL